MRDNKYWKCLKEEHRTSYQTCEKDSKECEEYELSECIKCSKGYVLQKNGTCVLEEEMKTCTSSIGSECIRCENGYYSKEKECLECPDNCKVCMDSTKCITYFLTL